jgi:hypothetical protein
MAVGRPHGLFYLYAVPMVIAMLTVRGLPVK